MRDKRQMCCTLYMICTWPLEHTSRRQFTKQWRDCTNLDLSLSMMMMMMMIIREFNNNNRNERRYSRFFTISSQRSELSPTRTLKWPGRNRVQTMCNTSSAYHVQVSCYVPLSTKGQLSYQVWQSWNCIYLSFILLAEPLNRWRRGGNRSTRRKPLATSFRKCHILQPEDSSPKRDSNPRSSIGGRLGKQTC